jgi:OOP family OmpA-OmpF porin
MKMGNGKILAAVAVAALGTVAQPAAAQWYVGASAGATSTSLKESYVPVSGTTANSYSKDERDTGYKLQLGYRANDYFAVEGGYVDLGKFSITNNVTAPFVGSLTGSGKADGWDVFAVGFVPLSNGFSLFGKLGAIRSTVKADYSTTGAVFLAPGVTPSRKNTEWNWAYGLGVQYEINQTLSVRGEWERYDKLGKEGGIGNAGEYSFNLYSIGLNFKF